MMKKIIAQLLIISLAFNPVLAGTLDAGTVIPSPLIIGGTLSRTALVATVTSTITGSTYSQLTTDVDLLINYAGTCTITLLNPASYTGRYISLRTYQAQAVISASSSVSINGTVGTAILGATAGKWATLKSDGTNWVMLGNN